jgi:predicted O-linked N-acetylglucosamine transferase (SPINDLY family)
MNLKSSYSTNPFSLAKSSITLPDNSALSLLSEAIQLHQNGHLSKAEQIYRQLLKLDPKNSEALNFLGLICYQKQDYLFAAELIRQAIHICPTVASYHSNLGIVLQELMQFERAVKSFDLAISLKPDFAEAYSNRGNALISLKDFEGALVSCDMAVKLKPDFAKAYSNRGNALLELKKPEAAVLSYDKAIAIHPGYAEAYSNRGNALRDLRQLEAAISSYGKSIELKPDFFEAYSNLANVLKELKRLVEAVKFYDKAICLKPEFAVGYVNRGNALFELKQFEEAVASYDKATALQPDYKYVLGMRHHAKMHACHWLDFEIEAAVVNQKIKKNEPCAPAFVTISLTTSLALQHQASKTWIKDKHPFDPSLGPIPKSARHSKIRIGYYSADFRNHPVSILSVGLFEHHDKSKFEVIGFSFGPDVKDEMHERLIKSFDQVIDVRSMSDAQVASLSRSLEVDIAVDLGGHTLDSRTGIFAYRAAPIQLSYIGYLGTMGANYYDYLIADRTIIPAESQGFYSEKIVYLPSYQVNDNKQEIPRTALSRQELNLPSRGFVYCCFNANYKITPSTFDGWMRILKAVPGSVLLLYTDIPSAAKNLKEEAKKRGVDPERLIFGEKLIRAKYLARCRAADLFLDTLPYNAGATASDALWAGLPVLTCMGESFASRYAASLLNAIGLPELVTQTQAEYEALAIELANDPAKLQEIKDKLERNRLTTPLFDTPGFTKNIEAAYTQMYERYQDDLLPEHIYSNA